ncbi:AlbA family DNA-binding domain-containing protein [Shewanella nanhaiensis]|uniref:ATP-binding protein n=1 Tax=Shewanella nanhaiensis TaxID=2864872 RepID=A0ABS7E819_9GAMM|nr:ATP-binding protein [Shewanella nanhaiensis]MBW8185503.1 ATP-binding protein [Shewanella nanhaiensis]
MHYSYSPFKKRLNDIDHEDLLLLRDVSEGWYVDYKIKGLKVADFAKHLSAFANQYGGWLIIGIAESTNGTRTAGDFVGIENSHVEKVCTDIREASSAHINPEVFYDERIVRGPIKEIGLEAGKSIIIICVPTSFNTPHIHSSGRIYKRVADQSKPKEETDRYQLDKLWLRNQEHKKKVSDLLTTIPELSSIQSSTPWLHVYLKKSDFQIPPSENLSFSSFRSIVQEQGDKLLRSFAPLESVSTTANGYIARQVKGNAPMCNCLTLRWFHDGVVRLDIPLNSYGIEDFCIQYKGNKNAVEFFKNLRENVDQKYYEHIRIVDYSLLATTLNSLYGTCLYLFNEIDDVRNSFSCFTLRNTAHSFPFFDTESFIEKVNQDGLPLTHENLISMPVNPTEESMDLIDIDYDSLDFSSCMDVTMAITELSVSTMTKVLFTVGAFIETDDFNKVSDFYELKLSNK